MPTPGTQADTAAQGSDMPTPRMAGGAAGDDMPRPGGTFAAASSGVEGAVASSSEEMPIPSFARTSRADSDEGSPGGGPALPRFTAPGGRPVSPSFEPGVVEVLFREGVSPSVTAATAGLPGEIASPAAALSDVNRVLQRYRIQRIEPTFQLSQEAATTAQSVARGQGIDVPHLAHFVTLRFPGDVDVQAIADELSQLPDVEKAVPVPTALPPAMTIAPPPRIAASLMPEEELQLEEAPVGAAPPAGNPLGEPLAGSGDTVVVDPVTGLENQWYIFRCRVNGAWARSTGRNVVVADVDWGYRVAHEDLAANIGRTYNAFDGTANVNQGSSRFHGTGVLGLAGGVVNARGMAGVAYEASLWAVQGDSGTGPALGGNAWARGIDREAGARVIAAAQHPVAGAAGGSGA
ncbi:MAG: S8 family serine peptidase [Gemmatimonadota bacterium]